MEDLPIKNSARTYFAIPAACIAGSVWMDLAVALYPDSHSYPLSLGAVALGILLNFISILIVFAALGVPAFFAGVLIWKKIAPLSPAARRRGVYLSGTAYGLILGMIGSVAFGNDFSLSNLPSSIAIMGVAGVITALSFLVIIESRRHVG